MLNKSRYNTPVIACDTHKSASSVELAYAHANCVWFVYALNVINAILCKMLGQFNTTKLSHLTTYSWLVFKYVVRFQILNIR